MRLITFSTTSTTTTARAISIVAADSSLTSTAAAETVDVALAGILLGPPTVTSTTTTENTQTTSGLVIKPAAADPTAAYFEITAVTGGTLYQNNGTTPIPSGTFITLAQGAAGLKFTPTTGSLLQGNFFVQESTTATTAGLGGVPAEGTITVTASVTNPTGNQTVSLASAFNLVGITTDGAKFSGGLDGGGHALSASQVGTSLTWGGVQFSIAAAGANNVAQATGQTITLPERLVLEGGTAGDRRERQSAESDLHGPLHRWHLDNVYPKPQRLAHSARYRAKASRCRLRTATHLPASRIIPGHLTSMATRLP